MRVFLETDVAQKGKHEEEAVNGPSDFSPEPALGFRGLVVIIAHRGIFFFKVG